MDNIIRAIHTLIDVNFQLLLTGGAVVLCVLLLIVLLWFILRPLRLWYWKVGSHERKLEEIEEQIANIGKEIAQNKQTGGINAEKISLELIIEREKPECSKEQEDIEVAVQPKSQRQSEAECEESQLKADSEDRKEPYECGKNLQETSTRQEAVLTKRIESVKETESKSKLYCRENNTSKAGRVYTRVELQSIIKD